MDLPDYYRHLKDIRDGNVPSSIVDHANQEWDPFPINEQALNLSPWSNDWTTFDGIHNWILPASRWPVQDLKYGLADDLLSKIRLKLNIVGSTLVIPIAHCNEDVERVVVRVAGRLYRASIYSDEDEDDGLTYASERYLVQPMTLLMVNSLMKLLIPSTHSIT